MNSSKLSKIVEEIISKKASDRKEFTLEKLTEVANKLLNVTESDLKKYFANAGYGSKNVIFEKIEKKSNLIFSENKQYILQVVYLVGSYDKTVEDEPSYGKVYVQWNGDKIIADY